MARRQGAYKGGKPRLDGLRVEELSSRGLGPAAIARELGMARSSVYRLLREASSQRQVTAAGGLLVSITADSFRSASQRSTFTSAIYIPELWYPVVCSAVAAVIGFVAMLETHKTSL
jgi:hypothetical protein